MSPSIRAFLGHVLVLASYLAVSTAWSWPLARLDGLVTRQFDLFPAIWLVDRAPEALLSLHSGITGWPFGESLARADSYVLLLLGAAFGNRVDAPTICAILAWWGPVFSAFAAERAAAAYGVHRPWSWLAGCVYGFSGIAATALLEGHVYQLLNPWLPLMLVAWMRGRRRISGMWIGAAWAMALLTTAYFGVFGLVLLVVLALGDPGRASRLVPSALLVIAPVAAGYLWVFQLGGGFADTDTLRATDILAGSTSAAGLAGWTPAIDIAGHSLSAPVGWTGFWLLLLAPLVLRDEEGWRGLFWLGLGALVLTLGAAPTWDLGVPGWDFRYWAELVPGLEWFRFPLRAAWLYALVAGVVGARVLQEGAAAFPRFAIGAFVFTLADALLGSGLSARLDQGVSGAPSAYNAVKPGSAVLDLYGRPADRSAGEIELWARALGCYYQVFHGHPILEVCLGTGVDSPREQAERWLLRQAMGEPDLRSVADLGALGVGGVAVHADFYRPADLLALQQGLEGLFGAAAATSTDGGERVIVYTVPAVTGGQPAEAWARIVGR